MRTCTPRGRRDQRGQHFLAGVVAGKDIGLEIDFVLRAIDGGDQRREVIGAGVQQLDVVIGKNLRCA
jgi:hypothetical protein